MGIVLLSLQPLKEVLAQLVEHSPPVGGVPKANLGSDYLGGLAQLVEHLHGMQKVNGSNPLSSTALNEPLLIWVVFFCETISVGRAFPACTAGKLVLHHHSILSFTTLLHFKIIIKRTFCKGIHGLLNEPFWEL